MARDISTAPQAHAKGQREENLGLVVFIAAAAALGGFLFGYDSSVINGAVPGIEGHFDVGAGTTGLIVSSALLGCALGASVAGIIADRKGRLFVMRLAAVLFAASAIGSALPFDTWDLAAWRIVGGVAIGAASVIGPAYIAEVAPPAYRGRLASFQQMAIVLGITVSQVVNYAIAQRAGGNVRGHLLGIEAWQWMLGVMVIPAIVYFVMSALIPESPRFLIAVGQLPRAKRVLASIEGPGTDVDARVAEIKRVMASEQRSTLKDLRSGRYGLMPIVWIGIGLSALQQLVGINVIFYYSSSLWQSVGINESNSLLISVSTSIVNIFGTLLAMALVDKVGRKPLALVGSAGMAVALATAAWAFSYAHTAAGDNVTIPDTQATVALVAAHVFVFFFAMSWGVVVWVMLGEMFPNRIRSAAMSVAVAAQWIANWMITVSFPSLSEWSLTGTYIGYAAFAALSFVFVVKFLRETKGRKLEEMG